MSKSCRNRKVLTDLICSLVFLVLTPSTMMALKTLASLLLLGANSAILADALQPIRAQSVNSWLRTTARTNKHSLADVEHQRVFTRPPEFPELYFEQPLDHFSNDTSVVFGQRYWVNSRHYAEGGPVFVLDGGETSGEGESRRTC